MESNKNCDEFQADLKTKDIEIPSNKLRNSNNFDSTSPPYSNIIATPCIFLYNLIIFPQASPPNFISLDQLSEAANLFYNMNLVHEITVDSNFKFEFYTPPEDSLVKKVKETMHKAFWDILKEGLENDPVDYSQALRLLEEARESLLGLLTSTKNNRYLRAHIEAKLDLDQAKTRLAESGIFDLAEYGNIVIDLMAKMCAPARDEDVAALRTLKDPIEVFKKAFDVLDLMKMDMANYTISKMRSTIRQQAVHFEKDNFLKILETQRQAGIDGLQATKQWLKRAYTDLSDKLGQENGQTHDKSKIPVPNMILAEAYIMLLNIHNTLPFPETLMMDKERVERLKSRVGILVILASIILFTCTLLCQYFKVSKIEHLNKTSNQWHALKINILNHCRNLFALFIEENLKVGKGTNIIELATQSSVVHTQLMKDTRDWLAQYSEELNPKINATELEEKLGLVSKELASHIPLILEMNHPLYSTLCLNESPFA